MRVTCKITLSIAGDYSYAPPFEFHLSNMCLLIAVPILCLETCLAVKVHTFMEHAFHSSCGHQPQNDPSQCRLCRMLSCVSRVTDGHYGLCLGVPPKHHVLIDGTLGR